MARGLVFAFLFPIAALAQVEPEVPVADKIRFSAIVQFASEGADRIDARRARQPLNYKDAIYEGERLQLNSGSTVKLVTKNLCVIVVYGEGQATASEREKPWQIKAQAFRAVCPEGQNLKINFDITLETNGGEFLASSNRLLVIRGNPKAAGTSLKPMTMYTVDKDKLAPVQPPVSASEIYAFNQKHSPPQESTKLSEPEKPKRLAKPAKFRFLFGPTGGGGRLSHDQPSYSDTGMSNDGARVQLQFKKGKRSFLVTTNFANLDDSEAKGNHMGTEFPLRGTSTSKVKTTSLDAGMRFNHTRWWSPYARAGFAYMRNDLMYRDSNGAYLRHIYEYYGITAAGGIDAMYSPSWLNWLGVYGFLELNLARSLGGGGDLNRDNCGSFACTSPVLPGDPHAPITIIAGQFGLGLFLQF